MHTRVIDRAIAWAEKLGMSKAAFARAMGVEPQHVNNWMARDMPAHRHKKAAQVLHCTVDQLLSGELHPPSGGSPVSRVSAVPVGIHHANIVPVVPWEELMIRKLPPVFKLSAPDDAMAPTLRKGQMVELTLGVEPRPGDGVLVRDTSGDHYLRRYRERRKGQWSAHAEHPDIDTMESDRDGLVIVAVVTATEGRWS